MIYFKSALAGLLAVAAATIVLPILVVLATVLYSAIHPPLEGAVGWDPISLVHPRLPFVGFMVICFASGYVWEFLRLRHR
jgi:hypothetical protein